MRVSRRRYHLRWEAVAFSGVAMILLLAMMGGNDEHTVLHRIRLLQGHRSGITDPALYRTDGTMQISRTNALVLIHVPKTGGTTIEKSRLFHDTSRHHRIGGHFSVDEMLVARRGRRLENATVVSLVRHPCNRFISAFYMLKHGGNAGDRNLARHFDIVGKGLDIDAWVQLMKVREAGHLGPGWLVVKKYIRHFQNMADFLFHRDGTFGVDRLFCQENFSDAIAYLRKWYGNPYYSNHIPNWRKFQHEECSELSEDTRLFIEEKYRLDYCVFGYKTGLHGAADAKSCVGDLMNKDEFTLRYKECRTLIEQGISW